MDYFRKLFLKIKDGSIREMLRELAWVFRYSRRWRLWIVFYTGLGLLSIAMGLAAGVLSKYIIDAVTGFDSVALIPGAVAYVVMQLLRIAINALTGRISLDVKLRTDQQLRAEVYDAVMNARWEAAAAFHSGDILDRVDNDVSTVAAGILGWLPDIICRLVQFVGTLAVILYFDTTLALLALLSAPATLVVSGFMMKRLRSHNQRLRSLSARLMAFNEESFQNAQTVKSFGLSGFYGEKLRREQGIYREAALSYNRFQVITTSVLGLVATLVSITTFCWGVYRLWSGHITYGTMTLFLQLASTLAAAFSALVHLLPGTISLATAAGRITAILQLPQEDHSDAPAAAAFRQTHSQVGVELDRVSYGYPDSDRVLEDISVSVQPGQVVALVGASGEGKTTVLRLLLGLVDPAGGSIRAFSGEDSIPLSPGTRSLFSYVPQKCTLFSGTVAENLRVVRPNATDEELFEALEAACAARFIRRNPLGLEARVQEQGGGFSQGQIQRLMIARALLADAPVLLLDEATSALDEKTEEQVIENLMNDRRGRTCIVTTHRTGVLKKCSRILRIQGGTVTEESP
ncbi:MAG: ABC transporter ATP-binding protein [Oscillospiraceae bacterium]|nr:ABC transporter ATP-binding protein [Oscillospiraceae bacterium]